MICKYRRIGDFVQDWRREAQAAKLGAGKKEGVPSRLCDELLLLSPVHNGQNCNKAASINLQGMQAFNRQGQYSVAAT